MNINNLRKTTLLGFITLLTVVFSSASADNFSRWDCCSKGCHLSPAQPCCDDCGFFAGGDFLWWKACSSDHDFAVDTDINPSGGPQVDGKEYHVDFDWDSGFRATLGYRLGYDGWDVRAVYTYFHNSGDRSISNKDGLELGSTIATPSIRTGRDHFEKATAKINLDFDLLDFVASRPFCISKTMIMRPYFGPRALILSQKEKYHYDDVSTGNELDIDWRGRTEAAGLLAGVEWNMHLCDGFSLYANSAGSVLATWNNHGTIHQVSKGFDDSDFKIKGSVDCAGIPAYHIAAGFNWETQICDWCFDLNLGYEFNHWFNLPEPRRFHDAESDASASSGSREMLLHGVTLNANVYF